MIQNYYAVYEFMVSKFGGQSFESVDAFLQGVNSTTATKRFIPSKAWGMYNIDTKLMLAEGYYCRYGFDLIKVKNGVVTEYYRRLLSGNGASFIAYDLDTLAIIEYYKVIGNQEWKYDWHTGNELQGNTFCDYSKLPDDFKARVNDFYYKYDIFAYAHKPYGRIVEFYYFRK